MINIDLYLNKGSIDNNKLEVLKELIQFFYSEDIKIDDLLDVEEKLNVLKDDLNASFLSLMYQKIDLIKKDNELNLMFSFLLNDFKNYNEFTKEMGMCVKDIKNIIESRYGGCFKNSKLEEKLNVLDSWEKEHRIKKFKLYDEFLWVYLNSRYYTSVVKKMTGVSPSEFLLGIDKYELRENYPENIEDVIQDKINLLTKSKVSRVSDFVLIRDMEIFKIVNEDVLKVSSKDYKKLEVVLEYLRNYGNIDRMSNNYRYNQTVVFSILNYVMKSGLLNQETYLKLKNYDLVHTDLYSLSGKERVVLVQNMLIKYYKCNGNLVKLIESERNRELVLRLLNDDIANVILGDRDYQKVLISLKEYSEKEEVIKIIRKIKEPVIISSDK